MDLTQPLVLSLPWHLAPYRPILFPLLMSLLWLGLLLFEHRRRRRTAGSRTWYPPRDASGPTDEARPAAREAAAAIAHLRQRRWEAAMRLLAANTELSDAWTAYHLGLAYMGLGAPREAEACYRAALELDPAHRDAAFNLACLCTALGRTPEAIALYRQVIARDTADVDAHYNLGHQYFTLRLYPQALESWRSALELDPDASDVATNLSLLQRMPGALTPMAQAHPAAS